MSRVRHRIIEPEILDSVDDRSAARNLADIARINRWTGARRKLISLLRERFRPGERFTMLDVGAASGDFARHIGRQLSGARVVCLDLIGRNLRLAPQPRVQGDAFRLPFRDKSFDVAHCSLFLHHFDEAQAAAILTEMKRVARRSILIQDLHRHWISYNFLSSTKWLLRWHPVTVDDGRKSVAAGWRKDELVKLLIQLDLFNRARIRWHFPSFRFFIAIDGTD